MPVILAVRRCRHARIALILFALVFAWPLSLEASSITLYVFNEGTPVKDIEVLVDGELMTLTDARGVAELQLQSGIRLLELRMQDSVVLQQQVLAVQDEISQWIVDVTGGGSALFETESSAPAGVVGAREVASEVTGPPGRIEGRLISAEDGSVVVGARIYISGVASETVSDQDGRFATEVPAGIRSISVLHQGFSTLTRDGLEVIPEQRVTIELELTPAGTELPEFVVLAPFISGSLASVLEERQQSETIAELLSTEQIARAGDSDAAGALKRVTGLTLVGEGFVYVRGLGERYSSTTLNGMSMPSPDPTRRVVPLDLFPADILDSVLVQKTFSPWVPGEFGGGTIELRTVGMPEEGFFKVSAGLEYLDGTSLQDGLRYQGGGSDWTGYDDGARDLPDSMCEALCDGTELRQTSPFLPGGFSPAEIEQFGEDLSDVWDVEPQTVPLNGGLSLSGGDRWNWGDFSAGFTASALWGQDWQSREEIRRVFTASSAGLAPVDDLERFITRRKVSMSGYVSGEVSWKERHSLTFTHMLLRNSEDRAQADTGINESPDQFVLLRRLQWEENELTVSQLGGRDVIGKLGDLELEWQLATANANREEPKTQNYRYETDSSGQLALSSRAESNSVIYSKLDDEAESHSLQASKRFDFFQNSALDVRLGTGEIDRNRDSVLRRFTFQGIGPLSRNPELRRNLSLEEILVNENIGQSGFQLRETTQATDNYTAELNQRFSFLSFNYDWDERIQLGLGVRQEDHFQRVETFELFKPEAPPLIGELDNKGALPAASFTWKFRPGMQLRLGYSETLNRPDIRELAAAPYDDPLLDETIIGNPDLTQAEITNYDMRWEWYPGEFQSFSVAAFYKEFVDPIEKIIQPGAFNVTTLSNAEGAENFGLEADFRIQLTPLDKWMDQVPLLRSIPFSGIYFSGNVAWIESEIRLRPEDVVTNTNATRPLEGQSPYVINLQLGYDSDDERWAATLLYNTFGERIVKVGILSAPDIYEQPAHALDFTLQFKLNERWRFGFKAENLLDTTFEYTQGPEVTRSYQNGRSISFSATWEL